MGRNKILHSVQESAGRENVRRILRIKIYSKSRQWQMFYFDLDKMK